MSAGLIIAGGSVTALAAAALGLRYRRDMSRRRAVATRHGWQICRDPETALGLTFDTMALTQLGHSRRVREAFRHGDQTLLIDYVFETGFEERRRSHHWMMVAIEGEHRSSRAAITRYDWLAITAGGRATRRLTIASPTQSDASDGSLIVTVDDANEWEQRLPKLRAWLLAQPPTRSWEVLPGRVIGYEPGGFDEQRLGELESACRDLAARLRE
jgi:hypothetical protein